MTTSQIKDPYTIAELRTMIESHEYSAEMLLQHAMFRLTEKETECNQRKGLYYEWQPAADFAQTLYDEGKLPCGSLGRHCGPLLIEHVTRLADDRDNLVQRVKDLEAQRDELQKRGMAQAIQSMNALANVSDLQAENEELKAKLEKIEQLIRAE